MATQISSAILLNISDIAYTIHVDGEYCWIWLKQAHIDMLDVWISVTEMPMP